MSFDRHLLPILFVLSALGGSALACGEEGDGGDPVGERGGCCTEDTDSAHDQTVVCDDAPADCGEIGQTSVEQEAGCCLEGSLYWCDDSQLDSIDCVADGLACEYDPDIDAMGCV